MTLGAGIGWMERVGRRVRGAVVASSCGSLSSTLIPSVATMGEGLFPS
jgi:hypothetical protein